MVIATEVLGALVIILGWKTRIAAILLAGFSLLTALAFHRNFADQVQMIMFLKNVSIAGPSGLETAARKPHSTPQGVKPMPTSISTLLIRNLDDVFGENDPARRRARIDEIFHEDAVFYDPSNEVYRGRDGQRRTGPVGIRTSG